jgi:hypothetical protein
MSENFHIFVIIATIAYFVILKIYKYKILSDKKSKTKSSNLIFLFFLPILLYLFKYLFIRPPTITTEIIHQSPISFNGSDISSF